MAEHHTPIAARTAASVPLLDRGDQVPHFDVLTVDGQRVRYTEFWQHQNLVFVSLDLQSHPEHRQYAANLRARRDEFSGEETVLVISSEAVGGLPSPGVIVADKWGEIVHVFRPDEPGASMPDADDLLDWVHFVRIQCPECPPQ
jgi:peroxiredoxin